MSYSRKDEAVMRRIVTFLRNQGIKVWVDNEKLVPGTPIWESEIEKAIIGASAVIVILSPDSKESVWVRREISYAEQYSKRIFPVMVRGDEDSSMTLRLITRQYADIRINEDAGLRTLKQALSAYLNELESQERKIQAENERLAQAQAKRKAEEDRLTMKKAEAGRLAAQKVEEERLEYQRAAIQKSNEERLAREKAKVERKVKKEEINQITVRPRWVAVLWITLGLAINGIIGWGIGNTIEYAIRVTATTSGAVYYRLEHVIGWVISGAIGLAIDGFAIAMTLRFEKVISDWKRALWVILSWAISGVFGLAIIIVLGWSIMTGIGWLTSGAIGLVFAGFAIAMILRFDEVISDWKSTLWIALGWASSGIISLAIVDPNQTYFGNENYFGWLINPAISFVISGAISGAIGGFVMIWQIRKGKMAEFQSISSHQVSS